MPNIGCMRRKWSHSLWLLGLVALANAGCSGINASKSVSPLDFLLPGLHIQNDTPGLTTPNGTPVLVCWGGDRLPHPVP